MNFIKHSNLSGHAPFSPSQPAWLRYDDDKAIKYLIAKKASERGTRLHAYLTAQLMEIWRLKRLVLQHLI